MHVHTVRISGGTTTSVVCEGCDIALRLATRDEAIFVQQTDGWAFDGPMIGPNNVVVVPTDYSLWPTDDPHVDAPAFPDDFDLRPDQKWLSRPGHTGDLFDPEDEEE